MKKIFLLILSIVVALVIITGISFCSWYMWRSHSPGIVANAQIDIDASEIFSLQEIESAVEVVKETFASQRDSWNELAYIQYNEAQSINRIRRNGWDENDTILLFITYYRIRDLGREVFDVPWFYVLHRDSPSDSWEVRSQGKII